MRSQKAGERRGARRHAGRGLSSGNREGQCGQVELDPVLELYWLPPEQFSCPQPTRRRAPRRRRQTRQRISKGAAEADGRGLAG
jgi:hypothetical protein